MWGLTKKVGKETACSGAEDEGEAAQASPQAKLKGCGDGLPRQMELYRIIESPEVIYTL